jgi:pimeloyl-ACP methyl ester carboxylesterase
MVMYDLPNYSEDDPKYKKLFTPVGSVVQLEDGKVHYVLDGPQNGELIVLMHGISTAAYQMAPLSSLLAKNGFRTLRFGTFEQNKQKTYAHQLFVWIDFYGRGHSDAPEAVYDEKLFVRQTHQLLNALRDSKVIEVFSTTCFVAFFFFFFGSDFGGRAELSISSRCVEHGWRCGCGVCL